MEPITLKSGEQITKDGLYIIPIERYHHDASLCDGPSISSSGLRTYENCPEKYWLHSPLNPHRIEQDTKQHFSFGKVAHALTVEGVMPDDVVVSEFDSFRTKAAQEWRDGQLALGKTIIKEADLAVIEAMAQRLAKEPLVKNGIFNGLVEHSLVWKDKPTEIWLRSRPDCIPMDGMLADYKTAASADPEDIRRDIGKYGYACQLALAAEGIARVMHRAVDSFALVVQEKTPPYTVTIAALDEDAIRWGARLNRMAIDRFARSIETNDWPSYHEGPITLGLPGWFTKKLEANDNLIPETPTLQEMANA